jgi:hypothetical protein
MRVGRGTGRCGTTCRSSPPASGPARTRWWSTHRPSRTTSPHAPYVHTHNIYIHTLFLEHAHTLAHCTLRAATCPSRCASPLRPTSLPAPPTFFPSPIVHLPRSPRVCFSCQAWESSAEGQKEGSECPLSPIEPVLGYVLEYDTSPDKFVAAVLHAFDAALQVHTQRHTHTKYTHTKHTHKVHTYIYTHYTLYTIYYILYIHTRQKARPCVPINWVPDQIEPPATWHVLTARPVCSLRGVV